MLFRTTSSSTSTLVGTRLLLRARQGKGLRRHPVDQGKARSDYLGSYLGVGAGSSGPNRDQHVRMSTKGPLCLGVALTALTLLSTLQSDSNPDLDTKIKKTRTNTNTNTSEDTTRNITFEPTATVSSASALRTRTRTIVESILNNVTVSLTNATSNRNLNLFPRLPTQNFALCDGQNNKQKMEFSSKKLPPNKIRTHPILCRDGTTVFPFSTPSRDEQLSRLQEEEFDVLVIGGGAVGSGVALEAQARGLSTAMVEADDFSAGTSGRSTKLIHGGIRYLETAFKKLDYGSYELVQEALEERAFMLNAAPYMNKPLPIMIPLYQWWEVPYYWAGAKVYDLVAWNNRAVPASYVISAEEAIFQFPSLKKEGLCGAIVYYDGQMNDTRMGLSIALTATQHGACIANRVKCVELLKDNDGKLKGALVQDTLTDKKWKIHAKVVVNATGVFSDAIRKMDDPNVVELIEPAAGVHVMFPAHFSPARMGLIVPKTRDGRVLFFLPWERVTLGGTTDTSYPITMTPKPTAEEVSFIINEANRYLSDDTTVGEKDVIAAWSGLRPLVKDPAKIGEGTKALSRSHVIEVLPSNLVTITGGKWTTYRRMAQDTIDRVLEEPANKELVQGHILLKSPTRDMQLIGADRAKIVCDQKFNRISVTLRQDYGLPEDICDHLIANYGTRALQIAEIIREGYLNVKPNTLYRLSRHRDDGQKGKGNESLLSQYPYIEAEVVFAVEQEYAVKAVDVIARRTRLAYVDSEAAKAVTPRVVEIMGALLKWNKTRKTQELEECLEFLKTMNVDRTNIISESQKK